MILVPLFDLKFLTEFAAVVQELQIGGTRRPTSRTRRTNGFGVTTEGTSGRHEGEVDAFDRFYNKLSANRRR